jgi:hypothetical protein
MLLNTYREYLHSIDVVPNEPWLTPSDDVVKYYELEMFCGGRQSSLTHCIPGSHVMTYDLTDAPDLKYKLHGSWMMMQFINRFLIYDVISRADTLSVASLTAALQTFEGVYCSWVFEEPELSHAGRGPRSQSKNTTTSLRLVVLQAAPHTFESKENPTLLEMAETGWLQKQRRDAGFDQGKEALEARIKAAFADATVELKDTQCVSQCIKYPEENKLRVFLNCNPSPVVYGVSSMHWALFRYSTKPGSGHLYPIPVMVRTVRWNGVSHWNQLRDQWNIGQASMLESIPNVRKQA